MISTLIISTISIRRISRVVLILIWLTIIHWILRRIHWIIHWIEHRIPILSLLIRHLISIGVVLILIVVLTILISLILITIHWIVILLLIVSSVLIARIVVCSHWIHWISSSHIVIISLLIILRAWVFHSSIRSRLHNLWSKVSFRLKADINRWKLKFLFLLE